MTHDYEIMGAPRNDNNACSKCNAAIDENHVPLILWADGGKLMWVYCEQCENEMFHKFYSETPA